MEPIWLNKGGWVRSLKNRSSTSWTALINCSVPWPIVATIVRGINCKQLPYKLSCIETEPEQQMSREEAGHSQCNTNEEKHNFKWLLIISLEVVTGLSASSLDYFYYCFKERAPRFCSPPTNAIHCSNGYRFTASSFLQYSTNDSKKC